MACLTRGFHYSVSPSDNNCKCARTCGTNYRTTAHYGASTDDWRVYEAQPNWPLASSGGRGPGGGVGITTAWRVAWPQLS